MACKACVLCIFTLPLTPAPSGTRGVTPLNSSIADKDKSGSDKKQTEGMLFGGKDRETSGQS